MRFIFLPPAYFKDHLICCKPIMRGDVSIILKKRTYNLLKKILLIDFL